jgi:hypothetical protein
VTADPRGVRQGALQHQKAHFALSFFRVDFDAWRYGPSHRSLFHMEARFEWRDAYALAIHVFQIDFYFLPLTRRASEFEDT